jgi:hypothetical protein
VTEICFYIGAKPLLAKPWFYKVVLKFWINYAGKLPLTGRMRDIMMWETRCMSSGFLLLNRYSDRGHQMDVWGIRLRFPVVGEGGGGCIFLLSTVLRPILGYVQPLVPWVSWAVYPGGKTAWTWSWPLTSI